MPSAFVLPYVADQADCMTLVPTTFVISYFVGLYIDSMAQLTLERDLERSSQAAVEAILIPLYLSYCA